MDSKKPPTSGSGDPDQRVGRILNDLLDRQKRGESISEAQLRAEYPEFADQLLAHLRILTDLKEPHDPIEQLIARGTLQESEDPECRAELGPYPITAFLGQGGMGIVLEARDDRLGRTVALKLLRAELAHDTTALRRFAREACAAGGLQHPNIVAVHAVGEERGAHYIVMEYVQGGTLADLIRNHGPLTAELARDLFSQVLYGLDAAHRAGLIHRDLKPSNILLGNGRAAGSSPTAYACSGDHHIIKLADFGLALMASGATRMTLPDAVLGTPEYMSPEQARGNDRIDHRADLYSAGVVLYEMLTGTTPFKAEKPSAVVHRILHEEPADPRTIVKGVDANLASLAIRLMAKRPEDRFAAAADAEAALEAGHRVKSVEQRRRRMRRLAVGIVVVGLACCLAWLATQNDGSSRISRTPAVVTKVWSTPDATDEHSRTTVWASYSDGRTKECFYDFEREAGAVREASLLDIDGDGQGDLIAAGTTSSVGGTSLFLLDLASQVTRSFDLAPTFGVTWPDLDGPPVGWGFRSLHAADVDGGPGDELIVVGGHITQYPRRVSIMDPDTGDTRSTFWHTGNIDEIIVVDEFPYNAEDHRPAIVAIGVNNKLDGFGHPVSGRDVIQRGQPMRETKYDQVPVVMVLDPQNMEGLGPPRTDRINLPPITPWAYAFLDFPTIVRGAPVSGESYNIGFRELREWDTHSHIQTKAVLQISVHRTDDGRTDRVWANFVLNADLDLITVFPDRWLPDKPTDSNTWEELWRPVVRRGEYLPR